MVVKSEAILIYNEKDRDIQRFFNGKRNLKGEKIKTTLQKKLKSFNKMIEYAELKTCYREFILKYFGEKMIRNYCGFCENCKKKKISKISHLRQRRLFQQ